MEALFMGICLAVTVLCMWSLRTGRIWTGILGSSALIFGVMLPIAASS